LRAKLAQCNAGEQVAKCVRMLLLLLLLQPNCKCLCMQEGTAKANTAHETAAQTATLQAAVCRHATQQILGKGTLTDDMCTLLQHACSLTALAS
jgi:hypothetical protein